jgi:hypothetical protein
VSGWIGRGLSMLVRAPYPRFFRGVVITSLLLHVLAAFRSEGFYHCDEHYQIIEFIAAKLGITPVSALTWDHHAHIRPWFQPALYYPFVRAFMALGIEEPRTLMLLLRLSTALFAWSALVAFSRTLPRFFTGDGAVRRVTLLGLHFFHLVPMLSCRTSSENFAQIFVLLGLTCFIEPGRLGPSLYASSGPSHVRLVEPAWVLGGVAFGCAFLSRYQAALFALGTGLWFVVYAREKLRFVLAAGSGFVAAVALGALMDRWGYGTWVFAPWNYLRVNLIEGVAAQFGRSPPWGFVTLFNQKLLPPFGMLWLVTLFGALVMLPRHLLTWTVAPFVLVHHVIAHKETRFLFPTLVLALVLAGLLLQRSLEIVQRKRWQAPRWLRASLPAFAGLLLALNLIGVLTYALSPTSPRWTILSRLDELAPGGYTLVTGNGYDAISTCGSNPTFYWGKRQWRRHSEASTFMARDARGLPVFHAWAGTPRSVLSNPFHARCTQLFPKFWVSSSLARDVWSSPALSSIAKNITTYAVYSCPSVALH